MRHLKEFKGKSKVIISISRNIAYQIIIATHYFQILFGSGNVDASAKIKCSIIITES